MFIDVTTIEPIMEISDEIKDLMFKINRCKRKIESAESSMDIWVPNGYSSQYSRGEYARAKREKKKPNLIWINIPRNFQNNLLL